MKPRVAVVAPLGRYEEYGVVKSWASRLGLFSSLEAAYLVADPGVDAGHVCRGRCVYVELPDGWFGAGRARQLGTRLALLETDADIIVYTDVNSWPVRDPLPALAELLARGCAASSLGTRAYGQPFWSAAAWHVPVQGRLEYRHFIPSRPGVYEVCCSNQPVFALARWAAELFLSQRNMLPYWGFENEDVFRWLLRLGRRNCAAAYDLFEHVYKKGFEPGRMTDRDFCWAEPWYRDLVEEGGLACNEAGWRLNYSFYAETYLGQDASQGLGRWARWLKSYVLLHG